MSIEFFTNSETMTYNRNCSITTLTRTAVEGITVPMALNRRKREPQNAENGQKIWPIESFRLTLRPETMENRLLWQ